MLTPTEHTTIRVHQGAGTPSVRTTGGVFRTMIQHRSHDSVRIALIPSRALLLAGDDIALDLDLGPGVRVHLVETSGTLAYAMRGGRARWRLNATLGQRSQLLHEALPWVSAQGSDVVRELDLDLAEGAQALVRETLVLGRHGEPAGELVSRTRVTRCGATVLVEEVWAEDLAPYRVLDGVLAFGLGELPSAPGATRSQTSAGDVIYRALAQEAHLCAEPLDRAWAQAVKGTAVVSV